MLERKKIEGQRLIEQKTLANTRIIDEEQQERRVLSERREILALVTVSLVVVAAGAWVALVMLANVRERRGEIGILRAMGVRGRTIASIFLTKAALIGLIGSAVGCGIGLVAAPWLHGRLGRSIAPEHLAAAGRAALLRPWEAVVILLAAPLLACAAAWLPAARAARQDPAVILQQE